MTVYSQPVPNLIQGVSQQSPLQRRDSQCEAQWDCINSPVEGSIARPAIEYLNILSPTGFSGGVFNGAYFYEIIRGNDEHYLAVIRSGVLKVFNLTDGSECSVTMTADGSYLTLPPGASSRDYFACQTVNDFTFIGNKSKTIAMASTTKAARPKEALVYFRAGGYSMTFQLAITYAGSTYTWKYTTPDNSNVINGPFIFTNQLAATFYRALTGFGAPYPDYGDASTGLGVGAASVGDTADDRYVREGQVSGIGGSGALGFNVEVTGNVLRIWRTDGNDFDIDCSDGQGDAYMKVFKDSAQAFSDLPSKGFPGFTLKVAGVSKTAEDDYYVQFVNSSASDGYWEETLAPGTRTSLDPATMPHVLVNTGVNAFEWREATWGERVVGDADSAKAPSFVGRVLQDLLYKAGRLGIMTEGSCVWSKTRNVYVYFPDTVQTVLASAPVDVDIAAADYIPLLRRAVTVDEGTFLWAQRQQLRVSSGQDPFKQDTIEILPSTAYEFAERCAPLRLGRTLFFVTELGGYVSVINLPFSGGKPQDDVDVTAHVPSYVASGVHRITGSPTLKTIFALTDGSPTGIYVYNWLVERDNIVQSAWNTWRVPCQSVLWASIYRSKLYVLVQRADGALLCTVNLQAKAKDNGGAYQTRLDLRAGEWQTVVAYDEDTNTSTVTLPFALPEAAADPTKALVVLRTSGGSYTRGREFKVLGVSGAVITVVGNLTGLQFYAGLRISAVRTESDFYLRTANGPVPAESLTVHGYTVTLANTGYTRVEVQHTNGQKFSEEWTGRSLGSPSGITGTPVLSDGQLHTGVNAGSTEAAVTLINDSFLPSAWQTAVWSYEAVLRAPTPRGVASAG